MRRTYRVTHKGYVVEGKAASSQNACRMAFRELIKAGLIKNTPKTDNNSDSTFEDTQVEVVED